MPAKKEIPRTIPDALDLATTYLDELWIAYMPEVPDISTLTIATKNFKAASKLVTKLLAELIAK